ncbi:hypothetical protein Ndes2526B_g00225 [Nannochloris sp. 'desiccata']
MSKASLRLNVLALHLNAPVFSSDAQHDVSTRSSLISQQECVAVSTLKFARPAAPADVVFARPVSEAPSSTEIEALGAANTTLNSQRTASASAQSLPSTSHFSSAQKLSPPLFARPEISGDALAPYNQQKESITLLALSSGSKQQQEQQQSSNSPETVVAASGHWAPQASVVENEFGYVLQAVVPGVNPKEVRAELLPGGRLVISGIRHHNRNTYSSSSSGSGDGAQPALLSTLPEVFGKPGWNRMVYNGNVLESGRFRLVWKLPGDANQESIRADFKDGCLLVSVTKESVFSLF